MSKKSPPGVRIPVDYKSIIASAMGRERPGYKPPPVQKTASMFNGQLDYFSFLASKRAGLTVAETDPNASEPTRPGAPRSS